MAEVTVAFKFFQQQTNVVLRVSTNPDLSSPIRSTPIATNEPEVAKVTLSGLQPSTLYFYGVEVNGVLQTNGRGKFKTAPEPMTPKSFTAGWSSCCGRGSENSSIFTTIKDQNLDFFCHLGDLYYHDISSNDKWAFHSNLDKVFRSPNQAAFYANTPVAYMWDDHDFGANNADGTSASRPAALTVYRERVPHYPLSNSSGPVYQAFTYGRVRFILTDLRSSSSKTSNSDDSNKSKMGAEQKAWFFNELARPEPFKIWCSTHPFLHPKESGDDSWGGYTTERKSISAEIKRLGLEGKMAIISGDMHAIAFDSGVGTKNQDGGNQAAIPVFHAAPLKQGESYKGGPYDLGHYPNGSTGHQWGKITVTDTGGATFTVRFDGMREGSSIVNRTLTINA